jgi:pyruvate kinase
MFKRCSVKTLAQLRASERKKYLNQAKSIYGNEGWVDDDVFPKDMQAGKAICKDGARVKVMVAGKDPVWFTVEVGQDEHVVPTSNPGVVFNGAYSVHTVEGAVHSACGTRWSTCY